MATKALTGDVRAAHIKRITRELAMDAHRLGFDCQAFIDHICNPAYGNPKDATFLPPGIRLDSSAWSIGVSLNIHLTVSDSSYLGYYATVELGWASCGKTIAQATHAVSLYTRAIEMAAIIEGLVC